jgi:hypothetical protein
MARLFRRNAPGSRWESDDEVFEEPEEFVLPEPVNPEFYDPSWDEWGDSSRKTPRIIFTSIAVVVVLVVALIILKPYIKSVVKPDAKAAPTTAGLGIIKPEQFVVKAGVNAGAPVEWQGSGSKSSEVHSYQAGLHVLRYKCACTGNFVVNMVDETDSSVAIPINVISNGTENGSVPMNLPAGNLRIKIQATGKWSLGVDPTAGAAPVALPFKLPLGGPQVIGPFPASTAVNVNFGAFFDPINPTTIDTMNQEGVVTGRVIQTQKATNPSVSLGPQPTPFYLVASQTPTIWILIVAGGS